MASPCPRAGDKPCGIMLLVGCRNRYVCMYVCMYVCRYVGRYVGRYVFFSHMKVGHPPEATPYLPPSTPPRRDILV